MLEFVSNTPVNGFSLGYLNGTELYVIRCDECRDLLPKCLRLDSKWLKLKIKLSKLDKNQVLNPKKLWTHSST